jgi:hypothetical protein
MKRATVIGTPLARLNGAVESAEMPNTKIGFNIATERLYHVNGLPRELYKPAIEVDVTAQRPGQDGDIILRTGLEYLKRELDERLFFYFFEKIRIQERHLSDRPVLIFIETGGIGLGVAIEEQRADRRHDDLFSIP